MNANELRIGNYYLRIEDNEPCAIDDAYSLYLIQQHGGIKPIPLTEEWHNKFGSIKNGYGSFEYKLPHLNNLFITIVFTDYYVMLRQGDRNPADDCVSVWNKDITKRDMHVHEWQNLYFALTQTELKLIK